MLRNLQCTKKARVSTEGQQSATPDEPTHPQTRSQSHLGGSKIILADVASLALQDCEECNEGPLDFL